jgi:hypothetical protein
VTKVGDKVRIKASVTDAELIDITYPLNEREGEFTIDYVNRSGVVLSNRWAIYHEMLEEVNDD